LVSPDISLSSAVFAAQFGRLVSGQKPSHVTKAPILCRIDEGKAISGLCLGLATRAEARVDWLRTVAFFLLLLTGGLLGVAYLIALLFAPRIRTVSDYQVLLRRSRQ
jgi:phage shock protein PspC (stress-responsive transcriptional regulator)